jgi:rRNA-processing protein FCF1
MLNQKRVWAEDKTKGDEIRELASLEEELVSFWQQNMDLCVSQEVIKEVKAILHNYQPGTLSASKLATLKAYSKAGYFV